tara:strand:- start:259 stop:492 length:234 start_codon:yes stop_codon:yes gene_type:complete
MSTQNKFRDMSDQCNEVVNTMKESKDKNELWDCRLAFKNMFANFETEYENRLRELDAEQEKELNQLRAIKKLLSTND